MEFDKRQAEKILAGLRRRVEPDDTESHDTEHWDVPGVDRESSHGPSKGASVGDPDIDAAIDALNVATGILNSFPSHRLSDSGAVQLLSDIADVRRRVDAAYVRSVASVDQRGAAKDCGLGVRTTAGLLKTIIGISPGRAKADVAAARLVHGQEPGGSESSDARPLAKMGELLAGGRVSLAHVDTAVRTLNTVPVHTLDEAFEPPDEDEAVQEVGSRQQTVREHICKYFADKSPSMTPENLRQLGKHLVEVLDPDADDYFDPDSFSRRSMTMSKDYTGMVFGTYQLDPAAGAALRAIIDPLSAPRPAQRDADGHVLIRDTRTAEQRRADALSELAAVAVPLVSDNPASPGGGHTGENTADGSADTQLTGDSTDGTARELTIEERRKLAREGADRLFGVDGVQSASAAEPSAASKLRPGRQQARITVITTMDKVSGRDRNPSHCLGTGDISPGTLSRLTCDATFERLVLDARGAVLDLGIPVRLASPAQRRAISARDKGCVFPGCDRPPSWCDIHHVVWYSEGGATDVSNMCVLCPAHHTLVHTGQWEMTMIDGIPYAKPKPGSIGYHGAGAPPNMFDTCTGGDTWVRNSYFDRLKEAEDFAAAVARSAPDTT